MATTTWTCNKDATTADNGTSLGAGAWDWLPTGDYAGYDYRTFMGFPYSFAGMVSITSAVLWMKTTTQVKVAFAGGGDMKLQRINGSWSEGTATSLSGSNAIERSNEPGVTGTIVNFNVNNTENTWDSVNITTIIQEAFAAGDFDGLRMVGATGSDVTEHWAREYGSNDAYIVVTYTTNTLPTAPTLSSPANGATAQSLTPTFIFTHNDAEADACASYDIQVSSNNDAFAVITHWDGVNQTSGISGNTITRAYGGSALANNTTYYWRCRTNDGTGDGTWSATRTFTTAKLPTTTLTEPSATGRLAKIDYTAGAGWASPRMEVGWTFACADGGTQQSYEVEVFNDSAGSPGSSLYDSGVVASSAARTLSIPATLTEGNYYHVRVRTVCSHGQTSVFAPGASTYYRVRARWGVILHRFDAGAAPVSWSTSGLSTTTGASNSVVLEYGSNSTTTTPGTFYASLASAALNRYFFYRAYLMAWGASPATTPSLNSLTLNYSSLTLAADGWTLAGSVGSIDTSTFVYGTQSVKHVNLGAGPYSTSQVVPCIPNTDYILSYRMKVDGNGGGLARVQDVPATYTLAAGPLVSVTTDWTRYATAVFNSGSNTSLTIVLRSGGDAGAIVWWDALKLEASTVVTPWTPGFLGTGVVADAGGLQVDAANGGIFRLRGSTGGAGDVVTLGANGLKFGGTQELYGDGAGTLRVIGRSATDDSYLQVVSPSGKRALLGATVSGDTNARLVISGDATLTGIEFGPGNAARDTNLYRSAANVLTTDDTLQVGGFFRQTGTSFPASPNTSDRYFRSDAGLGTDFRWDGSRWNSVNRHVLPLQNVATLPISPAAGTPVVISRATIPPMGTGTDLNLKELATSFYVASGTALSASHKWVGTFSKVDGSTPATIATITIDSGSSTTWRRVVNTLDVLLGSGYEELEISWTKTGSPGDLHALSTLSYYLVTT